MKRTSLLIALVFCAGSITAQSLKGITGKPDTSYTNYSAFISTKKTFPGITLVEEFTFATVSEKRNMLYSSVHDRNLSLDAFYPKKRTKQERAAIIIIHGGGWRSGNRTQHHPLAQSLARLGYVCFSPEYRLSTEALFPAAVHDIKSAIRWVKKNAGKFRVDTNKITVLGFSAGGELAAFMGATNGMAEFEGPGSLEKYTSSVQAVVDIDGTLSFVHPESGEGDDSKRTSAATHWFGYTKKENPALWIQASPLTHAGKHSPPTLFINSAVDRMHAGRDDFIKILNSFNIYSQVKKFENSPHGFCLFEPWFTPTVGYIDDFLKTVFKD